MRGEDLGSQKRVQLPRYISVSKQIIDTKGFLFIILAFQHSFTFSWCLAAAPSWEVPHSVALGPKLLYSNLTYNPET